MFAARVTSGIGLDGHHDDGVDYGFGDLRGAQRLRVIGLAGGVAAIGDEDDYLAPLPALQRYGAEIDGVIESRGRSGAQMVQGLVQTALVAGKGQSLRDVGRELVERNGIHRAQHGVRKLARRGDLQRQILAGAHAGIQGHGDGERQFRLALEDRDLLLDAIFIDTEVLLAADRRKDSPSLSATLAKTFTSFTFTEMVGEDCHRSRIAADRRPRNLRHAGG